MRDSRVRFRRLRRISAIGLVLAMGLPALGADDADVLRSLGSLRGASGKSIDARPEADGATVLIFLSTECPIANASSPTLNQLHDAFPPPRAKWIGVCLDPDLADSEIIEHAREYELKLDVAVDRRGELARGLGATVTPEAFVIDPQGKIRYHGRIDDRFAARGVRNANPDNEELKDALAAVLAGREVETPYVKPVGCPIPEVEADEVPSPTEDAAP